MVRIYEELLSGSGGLAVLPVERSIVIEAARLRALLKLRLPDAIHVASALAAQCDVFLSNDRRIKLPGDLTLLRLV